MQEYRGKYNSATVFTDIVDGETVSQIIQLLNSPIAEGQKIRLMPDVHAGNGCTVGTAMTIGGKLAPSLVGADIGCGMEVAFLAEKDVDCARLDEAVHSALPQGRGLRRYVHRCAKEAALDKLVCAKRIDLQAAELSMCTLGGGNHFVEMDRRNDGTLVLVIHSGSRRLGLEVARLYQRSAMDYMRKTRAEMTSLQLQLQGRDDEIEQQLHRLNQQKISEQFAYLEGQLLQDYLHDMRIVQRFAQLNRRAIAQEILRGCGLTATDRFDCVHNYVDTDNMILRKGAVSAQKGERVIIPLNMRDGALLCVGKGNDDWNCSAPHGAGRIMNRARAKKELSVEEFRRTMQGIFSTTVGEGTLDESPMAYKSAQSIVDNIGDTVDIAETVRPVYNYKSGESAKN